LMDDDSNANNSNNDDNDNNDNENDSNDDAADDADNDAEAANPAARSFASYSEFATWLRTQPPLQRRSSKHGGAAAEGWRADDPASWQPRQLANGKRHRKNAFITRVDYCCSRRAPATEAEKAIVSSLAGTR